MLTLDRLLRHAWLTGALVLVVGAVSLLQPSAAVACSIAGVYPHEIRQNREDDIAPGPVSLVSVDVEDLGEGEGCGSKSSCDGTGTISILVRAGDDVTQPASMGFSITLVSGSLPPDLILPDEPVRGWAQPDGTISLALLWDPARTDSMDFVLRVTAVDEAGNDGASTDVSVVALAPEHQACAAGTATTGAYWLVALFGALFLFRRGRDRISTPRGR